MKLHRREAVDDRNAFLHDSDEARFQGVYRYLFRPLGLKILLISWNTGREAAHEEKIEVIEGERFAVRVRPLDESGVYTLEGAGLDRTRLAVNVDSTEGDLMHLTRDDLAERLGGAPMTYAVGQGGLEEALKTQQAAGGWARNLLYAMIVLCLAETFLAWFFNRGA